MCQAYVLKMFSNIIVTPAKYVECNEKYVILNIRLWTDEPFSKTEMGFVERLSMYCMESKWCLGTIETTVT